MASMTYTPEDHHREMDRQRMALMQAQANPSFAGFGQPDVVYERTANTFWRVNEEFQLNTARMSEPIDELRIAVARWLI